MTPEKRRQDTVRQGKAAKILPLLLSFVFPILSTYTEAESYQASRSDPVVWIAPLDNIADYSGRGEDDFMQLFQSDAPWQHALAHVGVMKFYSNFVDQASDDQIKTAVNFLQAHHIKIAVETWVLHRSDNGCGDLEGYLPQGRTDLPDRMSRRIRDAGGEIDYIAIDESWQANFAPKGCHLSVAEIAHDAASIFATYKLYFPNVRLGDIENLPGNADASWRARYFAWADAIRTYTGEPLAFFHMDVDWRAPQWGDAISAFVPQLTRRGIPFGIIQNGNLGATTDWVATAMDNIIKYRQKNLPNPSEIVFQSWEAYPKTALPETSPTSLTYLINFYFSGATATTTRTDETRPIHRFYDPATGEHFYTASMSEGAAAGYTYEGIGFSVLIEAKSATVPLFRCYGGKMHYASTHPSCEESGAIEGLYGALYASPGPGRTAIYRMYQNSSGDHLLTENLSEGHEAGYVDEGILGYAPTVR